MKSILLGAGEVGSALYRALKDFYPTEVFDKYKHKQKIQGSFELMHV